MLIKLIKLINTLIVFFLLFFIPPRNDRQSPKMDKGSSLQRRGQAQAAAADADSVALDPR